MVTEATKGQGRSRWPCTHCEQAAEQRFAPSPTSKPGSQLTSSGATCNFLDRTLREAPQVNQGRGLMCQPLRCHLASSLSLRPSHLSSKSPNVSSLRAGPFLKVLPPVPQFAQHRVRLGRCQGPTSYTRLPLLTVRLHQIDLHVVWDQGVWQF